MTTMHLLHLLHFVFFSIILLGTRRTWTKDWIWNPSYIWLCRCFGDWRRRSSITQIETVPNIIRNESVVVECHSASIVSVYAHFLWFPSIVSTPVQIQIADLVCTRSVYIERIRRASLECSWPRVINPWSINLIQFNSIRFNCCD